LDYFNIYKIKLLKINSVEYIGSYHKEEICPKDGLPEFAFIGRSNVGKSSLINMLTHKKEIAKVSKQPGKTQSINFFMINKAWYLVDLPGYGYARTSQTMRANWLKMIRYYLRERKTLLIAFVLLDARHEVQKLDTEFIDWCGENGVPFAIIYTKSDKVSQLELSSNRKTVKNALLKSWESMPNEFVSSAETRIGREEILNFIDKLIK
jgi:GTP-binding protein